MCFWVSSARVFFFNFIFLNSSNFCFLESKKRRRLWNCQLQLFAKWAAFLSALLYFRVLYRNVVGTKLAHTQITHYSELTDYEKLIAKYSVSSIYYVYLGKQFKLESDKNYSRTSILSDMKHSKQIMPVTATPRCLRADISIWVESQLFLLWLNRVWRKHPRNVAKV